MTVVLPESAAESEASGHAPPLPPRRVSARVQFYAQTALLTLLFASPAILCLHSAFVADNDVWWHLRTGQWILQHHAVPHKEPYSVLAGMPWAAYSWLFEVIIYGLFHWLGLTGLLVYSSGMVLLVVICLYRMISRVQPDFILASLLTFAAMFSMGHLFTPRPWMFTILLFVLELDILMSARRTGQKTGLLWLPAIFILWANTHIQFVDGLFILGLAFAESVLARWWKGAQRGPGAVWLGLALAGSIAGTLLNPYGWRLYAVAHDLATQSGALNLITELQAIPFRSPPDYVVLLLAMGAVAALARHNKLLSFDGALLAFAILLSFRSQRDVWVTAAVAAIILASSIETSEGRTTKPGRMTFAAASVGALLIVCAGFRMWHLNNKALESGIDQVFPAEAAQQVAARQIQGPVYSTFNWGGYLIWSIRQPVMIDGRQNVYGDQRMDRSVATWSGEPGWSTDPALNSAGVVIGPVKAPLVQLLRTNPHFRDVYEDKVAVVFVPQRP